MLKTCGRSKVEDDTYIYELIYYIDFDFQIFIP